jgi:hypothetical protein
LHATKDLVHLKVKDVKTTEELPKLTEKTLGKRKECGIRNQFYWS